MNKFIAPNTMVEFGRICGAICALALDPFVQALRTPALQNGPLATVWIVKERARNVAAERTNIALFALSAFD
jgi:hypothetical protein